MVYSLGEQGREEEEGAGRKGERRRPRRRRAVSAYTSQARIYD